MTPQQEALYALHRNVPRSELSIAAQLEYDRLIPAWERGEVHPAAGELEAARLAWESKRAERLAARETGLARHTVNKSETNHTFRFRRGALLFVGIFFVGCSIGTIAGLAVSLPKATGRWGIWGIIGITVVMGFLLWAVWAGIRMPFTGVKISGGKMTIRNFSRTYTVNASEIRAITLEHNAASGGYWQPRVHLTDGRSIRLQGFPTGQVSRDHPPEPKLVKILDEIRALLGIPEQSSDDPAADN